MPSPTCRPVVMVIFTLLLALICAPISGRAANTCSPGSFSSSGTKPCDDCPAGTFTSQTGATSCCQCCAGFYSMSGASSCSQCNSNHPYSPPGSTSPSQCQSGTGFVTSCTMSGSTCPSVTPSPVSSGPPRRRAIKRQLCPKDHKNCPVYGMSGLRGYECVDIHNDLESCGGCAGNDSPFGQRAEDGGRDCSAIPNVDFVSCQGGKCIIENCSEGYVLSANGEECTPFFDRVSLQMNGN
ncbi:hypothetical protein SCP_0704060 [Sparassis crispa]|uniref:Protein CPL1-like domain-containing protein n=1 Tax=Sparassis crispa TaxID=139825 RepID=A0A401GSS0_9APHY|nr:hypothetical protein SCP_0704060 [Sparassis crispa]GBE85220.1 hypothetical protein SCP_0704060 [Sparassis crispa]